MRTRSWRRSRRSSCCRWNPNGVRSPTAPPPRSNRSGSPRLHKENAPESVDPGAFPFAVYRLLDPVDVKLQDPAAIVDPAFIGQVGGWNMGSAQGTDRA